jgi:hypothetical protein
MVNGRTEGSAVRGAKLRWTLGHLVAFGWPWNDISHPELERVSRAAMNARLLPYPHKLLGI